jgi:N-acetylglucosaminyl-diphospho-decaprenol L-rhamnosyltransferase
MAIGPGSAREGNRRSGRPMTDFSVVVVLHDSAGVLPALFASLARYAPAAQLVAVDTASSDDGPRIARDASAEVVELAGNPGFGAACNAGVQRARHAVTVLLNPDCELLDDSLSALVEAAASRDALWAPRLVSALGACERSAHALPGTLGPLLASPLHPPALPAPLRDRLEPWRADTPRPVGWAVAACLAARTALLRRLGPFDARQFLFYEDMDLCLRARAAGVPTIFDPRVRVRHLGGHATRRAYDGEPFELLAARRHAVVAGNRGATAARLDDATQLMTFATRTIAHGLTGGDWRRPEAQLRAAARAAAGAR